MKNNLFTQIVSENWDSLNDSEKTKRLQALEFENSKAQKRDEREVVLSSEAEESSMCFNKNNETITVGNFNSFDTSLVISALYGMGFQIACNDYFDNKSNLIAFGKIESERLTDEYKKFELICERAKQCNAEHIIPLGSYKMILSKYESAYYLLDKIISSCETEDDFKKLFSAYINAYKILHDHITVLQYFSKADISFEYIKKLVDDIDAKIHSDRIKGVSTNKIIFDCIKPELNDILLENHLLYELAAGFPGDLSDTTAEIFTDNYKKLASRKK